MITLIKFRIWSSARISRFFSKTTATLSHTEVLSCFSDEVVVELELDMLKFVAGFIVKSFGGEEIVGFEITGAYPFVLFKAAGYDGDVAETHFCYFL